MEIEDKNLLDLIYWARRYCDGRSTYAPSSFNQIYEMLKTKNPDLISKDQMDETLTDKGTFWPYAQDGMYRSDTGAYDAIPRKQLLIEKENDAIK